MGRRYTSTKCIRIIILLHKLMVVVFFHRFRLLLLSVFSAKIVSARLKLQFSVRQSVAFSHCYSCVTRSMKVFKLSRWCSEVRYSCALIRVHVFNCVILFRRFFLTGLVVCNRLCSLADSCVRSHLLGFVPLYSHTRTYILHFANAHTSILVHSRPQVLY